MSQLLFGRTNFARATVASMHTAASSLIDLTAGEGSKFPQPSTDGRPFLAGWWDDTSFPGDPTSDPNREIVQVNSRTADTLSVTRGADGTAAAPHSAAGASFRLALIPTAGVMTQIDSQFQGLGGGITDALQVVCDSPAALTILADRLSVRGRIFTTVSLAPSMATSGPNGRDGFTETANQWVSVWAIANDQGSLAGLFSTSETSPTLPAGYDLTRLLSWVRNDNGSDFLEYVQTQGQIEYREAFDSLAIVLNGISSAFTVASAAAFVPPGQTQIGLNARLQVDAGGAATAGFLRPSSRASMQPNGRLVALAVGAQNIDSQDLWFETTSARTFEWRTQTSSALMLINATGWRLAQAS